MNESDLEKVLDQVAKDLASATGTIREEVALHGDLLAPDPSPSEPAATPGHTPERLSLDVIFLDGRVLVTRPGGVTEVATSEGRPLEGTHRRSGDPAVHTTGVRTVTVQPPRRSLGILYPPSLHDCGPRWTPEPNTPGSTPTLRPACRIGRASENKP